MDIPILRAVLVPKLPLGNAVFEALLPYPCKLELKMQGFPSRSLGTSQSQAHRAKYNPHLDVPDLQQGETRMDIPILRADLGRNIGALAESFQATYSALGFVLKWVFIFSFGVLYY